MRLIFPAENGSFEASENSFLLFIDETGNEPLKDPNYLWSCVISIEKQIGEDNYKAQVISQEEVDAVLGH